ncbi:MAG: hypothetical protein WCB68_13065 [Pyrinomonadaceae bacterium]
MSSVIDSSMSPYTSYAEVERLVREFELCRLPRAKWTHHAHLTVALWYLMRHTEAEATVLIRDRIKLYNKACGVETTPTSGYHETITLFYIHAISRYLSNANKDCSFTSLLSGLIETCGNKNFPLEYYSRDRLMSWEARTEWVKPDLKNFN